jgi:hypothetical protein
MSRFGLCGIMVAHREQRDVLRDVLLEAANIVADLPGCEVGLCRGYRLPRLSQDRATIDFGRLADGECPDVHDTRPGRRAEAVIQAFRDWAGARSRT